MINFQPDQPTNAKVLVVISLLFLFNACTYNYYYTPDAHNNLRLSQAKQVKGEAGIYRSAGATGFAVQTAYSPLKHIGIQANYLNANTSPTESLKTQKGSLAIGTYYLQKFEPKNPGASYLFEPGFLFDAYAGISVGQNKNQVNQLFSVTTPARFYYHTYYFQAGVHFQSFRAVAIGYTFRFFYLDYKKVSTFGTIGDNLVDHIATINMNDPFLLRENSFKLSIGSDKINYYLSINFLSNGDIFNELFFKQSLQSGMEINISRLFQKKEAVVPAEF